MTCLFPINKFRSDDPVGTRSPEPPLTVAAVVVVVGVSRTADVDAAAKVLQVNHWRRAFGLLSTRDERFYTFDKLCIFQLC